MLESRISIKLFEAEREALYRLARVERRDTREQAAICIRQDLERRGFLPAISETAANSTGDGPTLETKGDDKAPLERVTA